MSEIMKRAEGVKETSNKEKTKKKVLIYSTPKISCDRFVPDLMLKQMDLCNYLPEVTHSATQLQSEGSS